MAAKRGNRKPSRKTKKAGGGGMWPWMAVAAVLSIVAYDHWSSIKPELASLSRSGATESPATVALIHPAAPAPQPKPVLKSSDSLPIPPAPIPVSAPIPSAAPTATSVSGSLSENFGLCGQGTHINCVFDGSTFWVKGAKIRIADIATPDADTSRCAEELRRANAAKLRLLSLLNAGPFVVQAQLPDSDQDGAKQRRIIRNGQSFGDLLISEGLAHRATDRAVSWCA